MKKIAGAWLAADHDEMFLPAVEPGEKNHTGLVEPRRRTEYMTRQRHGMREDRIEGGAIATAKRRECCRRRGRDRIEDAEKRIRVSRFVAPDQLGEIEIVTGVHAHAVWKAPSHGDLLMLVEQ